MAKILPDVKKIILLHNPIERAYSAYWHAIRYGYKTLSFKEALKVEAERLKRDFIGQDLAISAS